jgi:hypothetical protein
VADEQELRKFESLLNAKAASEMITNEICGKSSVSHTLELLRNNDKTLEQYELLAFRDS